MADIHKYNVKVYYEDTDVGGIVYYANYLKFTERARTEMIYDLFKLSHQNLKDQHDAIFVVRSCNIKYVKSALFEDNLTVETSIVKKSQVRLNLLQEVKRGEELLISSEIELAVVNKHGSVTKLPESLFKKLK